MSPITHEAHLEFDQLWNLAGVVYIVHIYRRVGRNSSFVKHILFSFSPVTLSIFGIVWKTEPYISH